jgi:hypothetical protein
MRFEDVNMVPLYYLLDGIESTRTAYLLRHTVTMCK